MGFNLGLPLSFYYPVLCNDWRNVPKFSPMLYGTGQLGHQLCNAIDAKVRNR